MNTRKNTKKFITVAVLISLGVVLSLFDRLISQGILSLLPGFAMIAPNFKLGLANIIILLLLYNYGAGCTLLGVTLKVLILALFNPNGAPMSFGGSYLSFFVMYLLFKLTKNIKYIIFVSAVGGFAHSLGQIIFGFLWYGLIDIKNLILQGEVNYDILIYSPAMLILGLITGVLIGLIAMQLHKTFKFNNVKQ